MMYFIEPNPHTTGGGDWILGDTKDLLKVAVDCETINYIELKQISLGEYLQAYIEGYTGETIPTTDDLADWSSFESDLKYFVKHGAHDTQTYYKAMSEVESYGNENLP